MRPDRRTAARGRAAFAAFVSAVSVGTWGAPAVGADELPIGGTVLEEDGSTLAGAEVTLHPVPAMAERDRLLAGGAAHPEPADRATTGEDGRFRLVAPDVGLWTVVARASGRVPMELSARALVHPEELEPVRLPPSAGLDLLVVDGEGAPVPEAVVEGRGAASPERNPHRRASPWRPVHRRLATTGRDGRTRLPRLEGERVAVWAVASGRVAHAVVEATPADGPLRLVLAGGPARRVQVVGPGGDPVAGAAVWAGVPVPMGLTGADGTLSVPAPGEPGADPVRLHVHGPDGLLGEGEIEPPDAAGPDSAEPGPLRIRLEAPTIVQGRILDAGRQEGIAGALVWPRSGTSAFVRTDRTGSFRLAMHPEWLDAGIHAAAPGFLELRSEVPEGGTPGSQEVTVLLHPAATLRGRVVDASERPVAGAALRVTREERMTRGRDATWGRSDGEGRFRIAGLPRGADLVVHARREGYSPAVETVAPRPPDPGTARGPAGSRPSPAFPEVRLVLHEGRLLRGRTVDEHGEPVPGARVVVLAEALSGPGWPPPPEALAEAETGAEGRFAVDDVVPGTLSLLVSAPGYAPFRERSAELPEGGGSTDLGDLVLEREVFVEGRVVDPAGEPIAEASIQLSPRGRSVRLPGRRMLGRAPGASEEDRRRTTGPDGRFRFGDLATGESVRLRISRDGYVTTRVEGLRAPTEEPVSVVLRPAAEVAGMVVDGSGRPVPGAHVRPSWRSGRPASVHVRLAETDEHGAFELTGLSPGAVALVAEAPGHQESGPVNLELAPGERREGVEVVLAEGVEVTGRVLDPDGLPVAGAGVQVLEVHGQRMAYRGEHATTGSDGRFTLDTLPEGRLTLRAHKEGFSPATEEIDLGPAGASAEIYLERGTEVRGRVLEADGSPGAGRTLRIAPHRSLLGSGARASAAADGSFAFRGVADGEYRLVVVEGHSVLWSSPEPVVVEGAPVSGLEIRLPSTATLQGRILGLDRSELRRVRVSGSSAGGGFHARRAGRVRRDGTYRIEGVTPGEWRITAESPLSGRQARGRVEIEEGQTIASLDLEFREGFTVRGVVERAGRSLPGATVQLSAQEYHGGRVTSDFEGRFRFQGVPRGEHRLTARDSQSGTALGRTVRVDGDRDLRLELEGYRLRGTVYAADGTGPVAEASVRLRRQEAPGDPPETSAMPSHTLTGRDGSFLLDGIAPGRWRLLVERAGYTAHAAEVEVAGGDVELAPVYLDRLPAEPR